MSVIERYLALAGEKRFAEGLPLIEEIVLLNPNMATSQFNYGICLAELGRHQDAARAFLCAYELDPDDGGTLFRGCLSLAAAVPLVERLWADSHTQSRPVPVSAGGVGRVLLRRLAVVALLRETLFEAQGTVSGGRSPFVEAGGND